LNSARKVRLIQTSGSEDKVTLRKERITHLQSKYYLGPFAQAPLQLYATTVPAVFLYFRMIAGKGYMSSILASIVHANFQQHVPQSWAAPSPVHDGAITPINAVDFFEEGTHSVTTVSSALKCACNNVLWE